MPISIPSFRPKETSTKSSVVIVKTTVTTSITQISVPDGGEFELFHQTEDGTVYIGYDDVSNADVKLENGDVMQFSNMKNNDGVEIYGIVDSGSIIVYAVSNINY